MVISILEDGSVSRVEIGLRKLALEEASSAILHCDRACCVYMAGLVRAQKGMDLPHTGGRCLP